jgi:hypothetical protein
MIRKKNFNKKRKDNIQNWIKLKKKKMEKFIKINKFIFQID